MNKSFYSYFVLHCMRYYSRYPNISNFKTEADKANWIACKKALAYYTDSEKKILMAVYSGRDTFADNVYETAKKYNINQDEIWDMIPKFERLVAKKRGLI